MMPVSTNREQVSREQEANNRFPRLITLGMAIKVAEYFKKTEDLLATPDTRDAREVAICLPRKTMKYIHRSLVLAELSRQPSSILSDASKLIALAELTFLFADIARDMTRLNQSDRV